MNLLAATNPDTGAFTCQYAVGAISFGLLLAGLLLLAAWINRHTNRTPDRFIDDALDPGAAQIRLAVDEAAAAHHDRSAHDYTVPRQLTGGHR